MTVKKELVKVRNTTDVVYNGCRPWIVIEVEDPRPLVLAGWKLLEEVKEELVEKTEKELLESKKFDDLKKIAVEKKIDITGIKKKTDLIEKILEVKEELETGETGTEDDIDDLTNDLQDE